MTIVTAERLGHSKKYKIFFF